MIEHLTFTGVDENTDRNWAEEIAGFYPRIEFGILVGTKTENICPPKPEASRFPSLSTIELWKAHARNAGMSLSLHLCGKYQRQVNNGDVSQKLLDLCAGFNRVQVNATKYNAGNIAKFVEQVKVPAVILQHRAAFNKSLPIQDNPRVEYLFDKSGGRGKNSINEWPMPTHRFRCGYSGGLNRRNINLVAPFHSQYMNHRVWFDMETGVRSHLGWFDLSEVNHICDKVWGYRDNYDRA